MKVKSNKGKEEGGLRKEMSANYCFRRVGQKIDEGKKVENFSELKDMSFSD